MSALDTPYVQHDFCFFVSRSFARQFWKLFGWIEKSRDWFRKHFDTCRANYQALIIIIWGNNLSFIVFQTTRQWDHFTSTDKEANRVSWHIVCMCGYYPLRYTTLTNLERSYMQISDGFVYVRVPFSEKTNLQTMEVSVDALDLLERKVS